MQTQHDEYGKHTHMNLGTALTVSGPACASPRARSEARASQARDTAHPPAWSSASAPIEWSSVSAPIEWSRVPAPIEWSRVSAPIEWSRVSAPIVWSSVSAPIEWSRVSAPIVWSRVSVPIGSHRAGTSPCCRCRDTKYRDDKSLLLQDAYLEFLDPRLCACKRVCVGDVIHDNRCLCATVVHRRQTVVPFLACRVPDFKLDGGVVEAYCLRQERGCK